MPALARAFACARLVVPAVLLAACLVLASPAGAAVVFDRGPGSGAPPDTVGPYAVSAYPTDTRVADVVHNAPAPSGSVSFSRPMALRRISDGGWISGPWAGGTFTGAVYWNLGGGSTTIALPEPRRAFYLYGQTDYFGTYAMIATAQDGTTSGEIQATTGPTGTNASFFGFYGTGDDRISSITITSPEADDDFAVASFGGGDAAPGHRGPAVQEITGDATVLEGATGSYAVAADDRDGRPLAYEWSVMSGPGTIAGPADGAAAAVRVDDGPATVHLQVVVADADGQAVTRRMVIHAANVPAAARLAARNDLQVAEGESRTYAYVIDDPGDDAIDRVDTSCGEGARKSEGSDSHSELAGSFECRFPDGPADPGVSVSVADSDGEGAAPDSQAVTVVDVAPVLTFAASDSHVDEGSTRLYPYTIEDPGDDSQRVVADCGEGGVKVAGSERNTDTTGSFECAFADGVALATVHAVATDSDGVLGRDDERDIAIANVPPGVAISGGARRTVADGRGAQVVQYAIDDPGDDEVAAVETSCGAGAKVAGSDQHSDTAGRFECVPGQGSAALTVAVRATDSDGDSGAIDTQVIELRAGALAVKLASSNKRSVDESATERSYAYAIGGPATGAVAGVRTDCGAGGKKVAGSDARSARSGRFRCVFRAGPATTAVSVTARDGAGRSTTDSQVVTILDPPVSAAGKQVTGVENAAIVNGKLARFSDPTPYSRAAEYAATIDWGDGTPPSAGTIAKDGDGVFSVRGTHTYRRLNLRGYPAVVSVVDVDNPANAASATSRAVIADAKIAVSGKDVTTAADFHGVVATLHDDGDGPPSDFSAAISWGDGATSAGTIGREPDGTLVVSGSHAYRGSGRYSARVRVESVGGSDDRAGVDVLVYAFAAGATFAIGDARAAAGTSVTFWGSRWSRENPLRSGAAVDASFKGLVAAPPGRALPRCGDAWTTSATAAAPADVPAFMGVVVTRAVRRSGSTFAGDVAKVVVVKTDGGYRPDPARGGTGKVVAVVCE